MCETIGYVDNIDYLDHLIIWLRHRSRRIVEKREPIPTLFPIRKAPQDDDWELHEKTVQREIQERLAVHQADDDPAPLGLEVLRANHDLNDDQVLILLACAVAAISEGLSQSVLGELGGSPFGIQVQQFLELIDPCCPPHGLEQLLTLRRLFRPATSKLLKAGLIVVQVDDDTLPAELLGCWVQLTNKGFKAVTGYAP